MKSEKIMLPKRLLTRSNLRDVTLVLSSVAAYFCPVSILRTGLSLGLLGVGCCLHLLVKGELTRNTVLCREGIYRFTRHPYYTANFLIDIGFCLLSGSIYLVLVYPFLFFWAYGPTLRDEERYLTSLYGDQYACFSHATAQVLPDGQSVVHWKNFLRGFSASRISYRERARIVRFCIGAAVILLLHDIGEEGIGEIISLHPQDYDGFVFLGLIVLFVVAQLGFLLSARTSLPEQGLKVWGVPLEQAGKPFMKCRAGFMKPHLKASALGCALVLVTARPANAYLDQGSGSMVWRLGVSAFAGIILYSLHRAAAWCRLSKLDA